MEIIDTLYQFADRNGIDVDWLPMRKASSLSVQLPDGSTAIAIDMMSVGSTASHKCGLGHELGHCMTGSFYNRNTPYDIVARHEKRADKWAIRRLVPLTELKAAILAGYTQVWELAEQFDVTEDFMRKAICLYKNGNLDPFE